MSPRRTFGAVFEPEETGKKFVARFRIGGHQHSARFGTRVAAEKWLDRQEDDFNAGRFTPPAAKRVRYEDLLKMVEADYKANGLRSGARLRTARAHLDLAFRGRPALLIRTDLLTEYVAARQDEGAAASSIVKELATLRRGFNLAIRAQRLPPGAKPAFPVLRVNNARQGFFERADFDALLKELPAYLRGVFLFGFLSGWRVRSEILPLTWTHVDRQAGVVRLDVGSTKNGDGRSFPYAVLPELQRLIEAQWRRRNGLYVFHHDGRPIRDCYGAWRSACERAATVTHANGLTEVVRPQLLDRIPHDLRRTAVRNLERAGVPRSVAMQLVGHKTESVYRRYAIVVERDLADGVARLAEATGTR